MLCGRNVDNSFAPYGVTKPVTYLETSQRWHLGERHLFSILVNLLKVIFKHRIKRDKPSKESDSLSFFLSIRLSIEREMSNMIQGVWKPQGDAEFLQETAEPSLSVRQVVWGLCLVTMTINLEATKHAVST